MIEALLLDFDGLLYDTETSAYDAWQELYAEHGARLPLDLWVREAIGRPPGGYEFDPLAHLERIAGVSIDAAPALARRDRRRRAMLPDTLMPAADRLLARARACGVRTAIVTSNSRARVVEHLARVECEHPFDAIVCADGDPTRGKPRPTLYLEALRGLGLDAGQAIAVEDSPNGVAAAQAAGLYTVAVPNAITRGAPGLERADRCLDTLLDLDFVFDCEVGALPVSDPRRLSERFRRPARWRRC